MTTIHGLKNCDTCKKASKWLDRFGVAYSFVDYRDNKPTPETLVEWAGKVGGFDALINKSSTTWRQLPDGRKSPGSAQNACDPRPPCLDRAVCRHP